MDGAFGKCRAARRSGEERFVDFGQSFQDRGVAGQILAHFDEGANKIGTHGDSARTVEDVGDH